MRGWMKVGALVCAALLSGLGAHAETLDEAVERLAKAGKSVRDVTMKGTFEIDMTMPTYTKAPPVERKITGAVETSALWQGDTLFMREFTTLTHTVPLGSKGPSVQSLSLVIVDGQNTWSEGRSPLLGKRILVAKGPIPAVGSPLPRNAMPIDSDVAELGALTLRGDLKATIARLAPRCDVALAGTGKVAGRATTTLQVTRKQKPVEKHPRETLTSLPIRMFLDFDNATGLCVACRSIGPAGEVMSSMVTATLQVNTGLDRALFRYTVPEGAEVNEVSTWEPVGPKAPEAVRPDVPNPKVSK